MYNFSLNFVVRDDFDNGSIPVTVSGVFSNDVLASVFDLSSVQTCLDSLMNTIHLVYKLALESVDMNIESGVKECFEK